ncbi:MAG: sialidase family protein [Armatimonadota bacterium]
MEYGAEFIFPPNDLHNHASCLVELPDGDLFAVWYSGSGEREADDVRIMGARCHSGVWSEPFVVADTPGFPDCNPCTAVDPRGHLWLFWPTILDNHWESALLKYKISSDYSDPSRPPRWYAEKVLHVKPGPEFQDAVKSNLEKHWLREAAGRSEEEVEAILQHCRRIQNLAESKLSCRLGWMPRAHPLVLESGRIILPLYSDGFDFSMMALTDDWGEHWSFSSPLVGAANIQPALAQRKDGTIVAYMRDNGPPPKRIMFSESSDCGVSWSDVSDTELPNPGSGVDVLVLQNGFWALVYNDTEEGRHSLAVSFSDDEGRTWMWTRHLERDDPGPEAGSYSYPSIVQSKDGVLHVTYSCAVPKGRLGIESGGREVCEAIKHAWFSPEWVICDCDS